MAKNELSRRQFIGKTTGVIAGVALVPGTSSLSAASYSRVMGANDRINIAFLGCGARGNGHQNMVKMSEKEKNLGVVAVCDIWKLNREKTASSCKRIFGNDVKQFRYSEELLAMQDLDAVMIATGDFQHAKILAEVVGARKDCYCEKPMATDLEDAILATYDEKKFLYSYTSNYASKFGDYTCIRGKEGTLFAHGGEGSPRWFFIPEKQDLPGGFDFYEGMKEAIKNRKAEIVTTEEYGMKMGTVSISDDSKYHLDNWVDCMRNRSMVPNGHIHTGFWHPVASIMATRAYREGKKLYWDRIKEEIVDHPVT